MSPDSERVASDLIQMEQYMDFVRNRTFRQTLLCHREVTVDRGLKPGGLDAFHVACPVVPVDPSADVHAPGEMKFRQPRGNRTLATSAPMMKAAMLILSQAWPASLPFSKLVSMASVRAFNHCVTSGERLRQDSFQLGKALLELYLGGSLELSSKDPPFSSQVDARPLASRLARLQAESGNTVTTLRHENVTLFELGRHVLRYLDGTRDKNAILAILTKLVSEETLVVPNQQQIGPMTTGLRTCLHDELDRTLVSLATSSLLLRNAN